MTPVLRLDSLYLINFRCFKMCGIELHPELTVFVAENGHGKTALLEAVAIAFGLFVDTISNTRQGSDLEYTDIRQVRDATGVMKPEPRVEFSANGIVQGKEINWRRSLGNWERSRPTTKDTKELQQAALEFRQAVEEFTGNEQEEPPLLPLVAFYGTERLWHDHKLPENQSNMIDQGRMDGYSGCLSSSSSFKGIASWYQARMNEARSPEYKVLPEFERPELSLAAVREATRVVLEPTKWCDLDWDFEQEQLVVEHPDHGRLPLSLLSDGIRTMIALVADVARRCVNLNPHLSDEAARKTPGVLLIDEVDMHLHPGWQQQVADLLRQSFPAMQIMLSTHSPQVLSTVDRESIRIIHFDDGTGILEKPKYQTRGVESADVLARIMGIDPVPQVAESRWLSEYRALIQQNLFDTPEADDLRGRLEHHFGQRHPVMLECDRLIRLERFKNKLPPLSK